MTGGLKKKNGFCICVVFVCSCFVLTRLFPRKEQLLYADVSLNRIFSSGAKLILLHRGQLPDNFTNLAYGPRSLN